MGEESKVFGSLEDWGESKDGEKIHLKSRLVHMYVEKGFLKKVMGYVRLVRALLGYVTQPCDMI